MTDIIVFLLKILAIVLFSMFLGYKTGIFSLGRWAAILSLIILVVFFSLEIYGSFIRNDISLVVSFRSSFLNFTLDLSFFIRVFLATLLMGLICSCFGVKPSARLSTAKDLCSLALLIAISVLLAVYGTIRIGEGIKISFKFISVFLTAALFGPLWGGAVAAISDVIAFIVNPVGGMFLPQISLVEFLYGFSFGLFFFNMRSWQGFKTMVTLIVCVIFQIVFLNLGLTTYFLMPVMKVDFNTLLAVRSVAALINMAIQLVVLAFFTKYIASFRRAIH